MKKLTLYHGSKKIISAPDVAFSASYNDYGSGFYCTRDEDMAGQWAVNRGSPGFINKYEIDAMALTVLDFNSDDKYTVLHMLAALFKYRKFKISSAHVVRFMDYLEKHFSTDVEKYDIVVGTRCDDSYLSFVKAFMLGQISVKQLRYLLSPGISGEEFVIKTPRAYEKLEFVSFYRADDAIYYPRRMIRDLNARAGFYAESDIGDDGGLYVADLLREEVKPDDERIR